MTSSTRRGGPATGVLPRAAGDRSPRSFTCRGCAWPGVLAAAGKPFRAGRAGPLPGPWCPIAAPATGPPPPAGPGAVHRRGAHCASMAAIPRRLQRRAGRVPGQRRAAAKAGPAGTGEGAPAGAARAMRAVRHCRARSCGRLLSVRSRVRRGPLPGRPGPGRDAGRGVRSWRRSVPGRGPGLGGAGGLGAGSGVAA